MKDRIPIKDRFKDKVAIVTGGTAGIGLATAKQLGLEGAKLTITGLPADGESAVEEMKKEGIEVIAVLGDMAKESFCKEVVSKTLNQWGKINYLVNNAFSFLAKGLDATREDFHYSFDAGPIAFATMIQLVSGPMKKEKGGAIVNLSSLSGKIAQKNRWTYNMGKGAVDQLTKCAALDLGHENIRVNCVSPGYIRTRELEKPAKDNPDLFKIWGDYGMLGRIASPTECAAAILYLLSEDASFITGTDLYVDGGYLGLGPDGIGKDVVWKN